MSKILGTICARGGSKGVKNKNIRDLNGKPLIAYTIEQAIWSGIFDHVVVSTDSDQIAEISEKYGAEVFFKRSPELSSDVAGKLDVIKDVFKRSEEHYSKKFDFLVDLDATSHLRYVDDIINSLAQLKNNNNTNLITASPSRKSPYFNLVEVDTNGVVVLSKQIEGKILRRQDAPKCYDMNASIYIWTRESILSSASLFTSSTGLYVMPESRSVDIDTELDFKFVEFLVKSNYAEIEQ